ncbi:MAG: pyridoxine 5'-phosphate synthase, partial [Planctomycetota bacterium]
ETVGVKLNMEMAMADEVVAIAEKLKPEQSTLVPERRQELTTEGGLDVARFRDRAKVVVARLKSAGIVASAFIEPILEQLRASKEVGFNAVELWTGAFAHAKTTQQREKALADLSGAIEEGRRLGLDVHAGHGLTYRNVAGVAALPGLSEFNIGHSIVARAVYVGVRAAVREMKELLEKYSPRHQCH